MLLDSELGVVCGVVSLRQGSTSCQLLLKHAAYRRMLVFLLGANRQNNQVSSSGFLRKTNGAFPRWLRLSSLVLNRLV